MQEKNLYIDGQFDNLDKKYRRLRKITAESITELGKKIETSVLKTENYINEKLKRVTTVRQLIEQKNFFNSHVVALTSLLTKQIEYLQTPK